MQLGLDILVDEVKGVGVDRVLFRTYEKNSKGVYSNPTRVAKPGG